MLGPISGAILWLYLFCYIGNHLTREFSRFGDEVYQLDWYMFPLQLQNNLPMALVLMQKNVYLEAYGGVGCTLKVFQRVLKLLSMRRDLYSDQHSDWALF